MLELDPRAGLPHEEIVAELGQRVGQWLVAQPLLNKRLGFVLAGLACRVPRPPRLTCNAEIPDWSLAKLALVEAVLPGQIVAMVSDFGTTQQSHLVNASSQVLSE